MPIKNFSIVDPKVELTNNWLSKVVAPPFFNEKYVGIIITAAHAAAITPPNTNIKNFFIYPLISFILFSVK